MHPNVFWALVAPMAKHRMAVTVLQTFPLVHCQGDFLVQNIGKEGAWKELERVKGRVTTGEERGSIWVFPES